ADAGERGADPPGRARHAGDDMAGAAMRGDDSGGLRLLAAAGERQHGEDQSAHDGTPTIAKALTRITAAKPKPSSMPQQARKRSGASPARWKSRIATAPPASATPRQRR